MKNYLLISCCFLLIVSSCTVQQSANDTYKLLQQRNKDTGMPTAAAWKADKDAQLVFLNTLSGRYSKMKSTNFAGSVTGIVLGGTIGLGGSILGMVPNTKAWWVAIPSLVTTSVSSITGGLNIKGRGDKLTTCLDLIDSRITTLTLSYSNARIDVYVQNNDVGAWNDYNTLGDNFEAQIKSNNCFK